MVSFSERNVFVVALDGLKVWNIVDKYLWCLVGLFFNTISRTLAIVGQLVLTDLQLALRELQMALRELQMALRELQMALREL